MKKYKLLALCLAPLFSASALAHDGTITFNGKVVAQTCSVNTGNSGNLSVTLPTVSSTSLKKDGDTVGLTPFSINLTGCTTGVNGAQNVKAFFEPGATTDFATNNLTNTGSANNVQVQILNSDGQTPILLGRDFAGQNVTAEAIQGSDVTLRYAARYYATGQASAGEVTSTVNYTVAYE